MVHFQIFTKGFDEIPAACKPECYGWNSQLYVAALHEYSKIEDVRLWKKIFEDLNFVRKVATNMIKLAARPENTYLQVSLLDSEDVLTNSIGRHLAFYDPVKENGLITRLFSYWTAFVFVKLYAHRYHIGNEVDTILRKRTLGEGVIELYEKFRIIKGNSKWFRYRLAMNDCEAAEIKAKNIIDVEIDGSKANNSQIDRVVQQPQLGTNCPELSQLDKEISDQENLLSQYNKILEDNRKQRLELEKSREEAEKILDSLKARRIKDKEDHAVIVHLRRVFPNVKVGFHIAVQSAMDYYMLVTTKVTKDASTSTTKLIPPVKTKQKDVKQVGKNNGSTANNREFTGAVAVQTGQPSIEIVGRKESSGGKSSAPGCTKNRVTSENLCTASCPPKASVSKRAHDVEKGLQVRSAKKGRSSQSESPIPIVQNKVSAKKEKNVIPVTAITIPKSPKVVKEVQVIQPEMDSEEWDRMLFSESYGTDNEEPPLTINEILLSGNMGKNVGHSVPEDKGKTKDAKRKEALSDSDSENSTSESEDSQDELDPLIADKLLNRKVPLHSENSDSD